jgi:hypothetical protein
MAERPSRLQDSVILQRRNNGYVRPVPNVLAHLAAEFEGLDTAE